ncbi:MAG TPA: insulinase family protein, partial [Tenuifilaceae bacterium]|nr:insulinase family protein [Tenuifilaceae bacterium]
NAFVTGDIDEGLLVVTGQLFPSTSFSDADESITSELEELKIKPVSDYELEKVKNRFESNFVFEETSILNKAINLSFYEQLGNAGYINQEVEKYRAVSTNRIMEVAREILSVNNCSTLYYQKN